MPRDRLTTPYRPSHPPSLRSLRRLHRTTCNGRSPLHRMVCNAARPAHYPLPPLLKPHLLAQLQRLPQQRLRLLGLAQGLKLTAQALGGGAGGRGRGEGDG